MQPSLQPFGSIAVFSLKMKTVGLRQPNQQRPQNSHLPLPGMIVPSLCLSSLPALSIRHTVHRDTVSDCTTECGQQKKASNRQQPKSNTRWMWCVLAVFAQSLSRDFTAHFSELVTQGFVLHTHARHTTSANSTWATSAGPSYRTGFCS